MIASSITVRPAESFINEASSWVVREDVAAPKINRRRHILHPRGVKFTSASVGAASPTNAELENQANWVRVWENKNVRLVAITHNN